MIIEFPKKYSVRKMGGLGAYFVSVPTENVQALSEVLKKQAWISAAYPPGVTEHFYVTISETYIQAHDALCRLCEHVMSPPVEIDMSVWGDSLSDDQST